MNQIARTPPAKIRARIHDNALKRVTRIYASTLADVLTETLQNSRRGGATGVRISVGTLTDQPGGETRSPSPSPTTEPASPIPPSC